MPFPKFNQFHECKQATATTETNPQSGQADRRFSPPWIVEELDACYVVKDSTGQKLAYVYFEDEPGRRSAAKLFSEDEAQRSFTAPLLLHGNGIAKAFTEDEKNYTNK